MDADRPEPPLTVPAELERDHLAEARRVVARSHRRSLVRSRPGRTQPTAPQARGRRVANAAHAFALLLLLLLAVLTDTWAIAAAMGGVLVVSLLVVRRTIAALFASPSTASNGARLPTDRSG